MNRRYKKLFFLLITVLAYISCSVSLAAGQNILYVAASDFGSEFVPTIYKIDLTAQEVVSKQEYSWDKGAMTGICEAKGKIIASMCEMGSHHEIFIIDPLTLVVDKKVPFTADIYLNGPYWDPIHERLGFRGKDTDTYVLDIEKGILRDPVDFGEVSFKHAITMDVERGCYFQLTREHGKCAINMRSTSDGKLLRNTRINLPEHHILDKVFIVRGQDIAIVRFWIHERPHKPGWPPVGSEIAKLDLATGNIVSHLPLANWRSILVAHSADGCKMVLREVVPENQLVLKIIETDTFNTTSTITIECNGNLGSILDGTFINEGKNLVLLADSRERREPGFIFIIDIKERAVQRIILPDAVRPVGMITMTN